MFELACILFLQAANRGVLLNKHEWWRNSTATLNVVFQLFLSTAESLYASLCLKVKCVLFLIGVYLAWTSHCQVSLYPCLLDCELLLNLRFFVGSWSLWLTVSFPSPSGRDWATWAFHRVQFSINHYCWLLWIRFNSSFMKSRHCSWFDKGCSIISCVIISLTPTWCWQSVHLTYFWANQKLC